MSLPRLQLFEFNDHPAAPRWLKDAIIETLSTTLRWGGVLIGLVPHITRFLREAETDEVLDLCAGAGAPAAILVETMEQVGEPPPRILLTDLLPQNEAWEELAVQHRGTIDFVPEAVDATAIEAEHSRGRARIIINALHHFPPGLVQGIFDDAITSNAPILIAEGFHRNPLGFLPFGIAGGAALATHPLRARRLRPLVAALTWGTPWVLAAAVWDGLVSTMRIYEERDLRAFVADAPAGWTWTFSSYPIPNGGKGLVFYGIPPG